MLACGSLSSVSQAKYSDLCVIPSTSWQRWVLAFISTNGEPVGRRMASVASPSVRQQYSMRVLPLPPLLLLLLLSSSSQRTYASSKSVQQIVSAAFRLNWIIYLREDARYDNYNLSFHNYVSWTQQGNGVRKVCHDITLQKRGKTRAESGAKKWPHWTLQPLTSTGFSVCPFQQRLKF